MRIPISMLSPGYSYKTRDYRAEQIILNLIRDETKRTLFVSNRCANMHQALEPPSTSSFFKPVTTLEVLSKFPEVVRTDREDMQMRNISINVHHIIDKSAS